MSGRHVSRQESERQVIVTVERQTYRGLRRAFSESGRCHAMGMSFNTLKTFNRKIDNKITDSEEFDPGSG